MGKYNDLMQHDIDRLLQETAQGSAGIPPPKAEAISIEKANSKPGFEELQGE